MHVSAQAQPTSQFQHITVRPVSGALGAEVSGIEADRERLHPTARTHPQTGRKALFVNPVYSLRLEDMSAEESAPLLRYLFDHATRPEFCCRFSWGRGDLAVWDNRCTQHLAVND